MIPNSKSLSAALAERDGTSLDDADQAVHAMRERLKLAKRAGCTYKDMVYTVQEMLGVDLYLYTTELLP